MKVFSERLIKLREEKKYGQRQMARILGITQPSYRRYELGTSEPNHEMTIKIAKEFGVTVDYLVGASDQRDVASPKV